MGDLGWGLSFGFLLIVALIFFWLRGFGGIFNSRLRTSSRLFIESAAMSRQPLLAQHPSASVEMGNHLIEQMPALASIVGQCALNWSDVELQLSSVLGAILSQSPGAIAVYNVVRRSGLQQKMLAAAADKELQGEMKKLFIAIYAITKDLDSQRNDIVHGVWGRSTEILDGAVWCDTDDHTQALAQHYLTNPKEPFDVNQHKHNYFVYTFEDLRRINNEINQLALAANYFHVRLRHPVGPTGDQALQQLYGLPRIRRELGLH